MSEHNLFPPNEGNDEGPDVEQIHVTRFSDGGQKYCAYLFGADELRGLQQIQEMFGGGNYELIARSEGKVSARRKYSLEGRSLPLVYGTEPRQPEPQPVTQVIQAPTNSSEMMQFMTMMVQQGQAQAQIQAQAQAAQLASQTQMTLGILTAMTSMITASAGGAAEGTKAAMAAITAAQDRAFAALLQTRGAGGGDLKAYKEGLTDGTSLKGDEGDDDKTLETLGQLAGVLGAVAGNGATGSVVEAVGAA
jgi:hypothetical protein